jgi:hypothetical protein
VVLAERLVQRQRHLNAQQVLQQVQALRSRTRAEFRQPLQVNAVMQQHARTRSHDYTFL